MVKVTIYSDGASSGNPGPGGYGAVLRRTDGLGELIEVELSEGFRFTTNNRMELMGAIKGLQRLQCPCEVDLYTDSEYVAHPFTKGWIYNWQHNGWKTSTKKDVSNQDLWRLLLEQCKIHSVTFHDVVAHKKINPTEHQVFNNRCDALAVEARKQSTDKLLVDEVYEAEHPWRA